MIDVESHGDENLSPPYREEGGLDLLSKGGGGVEVDVDLDMKMDLSHQTRQLEGGRTNPQNIIHCK